MEEIATKTLAEIYLNQGYLQKAYDIYKILLVQDPSDGDAQKRLMDLEKRMKSSPSTPKTLPLTRQERIKLLEEWLTRIRERKKT